VIVIGYHESQHVGGHDRRGVEARPYFAIGLDIRSRGRHIRQRRVIGVVLYGEFEDGFYRGFVPARKRLSRGDRLEMRHRQPPVNSLWFALLHVH